MEEVLVFQEKKVLAKGLVKHFPKEKKLKEFFFSEDYKKLKELKSQELKTQNLLLSSLQTPVLFYPGCGADILFPLLFMEKFFPKLERGTFIFADKEFTLGLIKTVLDEVGISFAENNKNENEQNFQWMNNSQNKPAILFYWKELLIELHFFQEDIFSLLPELPAFDVYFEKAFRIFKDENGLYEKNIFEKLKKNGILISDSGFQWLSSQNLQRIAVPKELSSYGEMVVGVKNESKKINRTRVPHFTN